MADPAGPVGGLDGLELAVPGDIILVMRDSSACCSKVSSSSSWSCALERRA